MNLNKREVLKYKNPEEMVWIPELLLLLTQIQRHSSSPRWVSKPVSMQAFSVGKSEQSEIRLKIRCLDKVEGLGVRVRFQGQVLRLGVGFLHVFQVYLRKHQHLRNHSYTLIRLDIFRWGCIDLHLKFYFICWIEKFHS